MAIILKISVRLTLKELRCGFSSSFDIISGSERGGILFLQIAVMFGMKTKQKKKKVRVKENIGTGIFSQTRRKRPFNNLKRNKTSREEVFFS